MFIVKNALRLSLFILFFQTFTSFTQFSNVSVFCQVDMNRYDFYSGIGISYKRNKFDYFSSIKLGIIKTFFQQRISPRFSVGVNYYLIEKSKIQLKPTISYNFSYLNYNHTKSNYHYWNELLMGYQFLIGKKIKLTQSTTLGPASEKYHSEILNKWERVYFLGYTLNIGVLYEF
ncbi:MAG: hypothetical protein HYR91_12550 [Flavobacteriia bacterium]|nr:hypothetical protein [Flavobacteriia bacterium]